MKQAIVEFSAKNGVVHSLDTATSAQETWLICNQYALTRDRRTSAGYWRGTMPCSYCATRKRLQAES
jgi:hypothetical protein